MQGKDKDQLSNKGWQKPVDNSTVYEYTDRGRGKSIYQGLTLDPKQLADYAKEAETNDARARDRQDTDELAKQYDQLMMAQRDVERRVTLLPQLPLRDLVEPKNADIPVQANSQQDSNSGISTSTILKAIGPSLVSLRKDPKVYESSLVNEVLTNPQLTVSSIDRQLEQRNSLASAANPEIGKIKNKFKINIQDVTLMVKSRFMGVHVKEELEDIQTIPEESAFVESKQTIEGVIQNFDIREKEEIQRAMLRDNDLGKVVSSKKLFISTFEEAKTYRDSNPSTHLSSFQDEAKETRGVSEALVENEMVEVPPFESELLHEVNHIVEGKTQGTICAMAVSRKTGRYIFYGTETGEIVECEVAKLTVKNNKMDSKITALGISLNDEYYVAGTDKSEVLFKKTEGKLGLKKLIKNLNTQKIVQILFLDNTSVLISTSFNVYHFTLKSYAVMMDVSMTVVLPKQEFIVSQLSTNLFNGVHQVLVVLNEKILLYNIIKEEKDKEVRVEKLTEDIDYPETMNKDVPNNRWMPMVSWFEMDEGTSASSYFLVFWKKLIYLVKFQKDTVEIKNRKEVASNIVWGCVLDNRVVCLITNLLEIEIFSIDKIFGNFYNSDNIYSKMNLNAGILKDQRDVNYITKYKTKLEDETVDISMKIPFFLFFRNRIRETNQELYLITEHGLFRYKMIGFEKLIEIYINKGKFISAIKLINNIMLKKISAKSEDVTTVAFLARSTIKKYLQQNMNSSVSEAEVCKMIDIGVECLLHSKNQDFIFSEIKDNFEPRLFWQQIATFIREGKISEINLDYISAGGVNYLEVQEILTLLRGFDFNKHKDDDQMVSQVMMILKKKSIWTLFYKFCLYCPGQAVQLFLSMLMSQVVLMDSKIKEKIIEELFWKDVKDLPIDDYFNDSQRRSFFRIFWFLNLLFAKGALESSVGFFVENINEVWDNIPDLYSKSLEWLLEKGNSKALLETNSQMYFSIVGTMMNNPAFLSSSKVIDVVQKIKSIYLKKRESNPTDLGYVASFRSSEKLRLEPSGGVVMEALFIILEDILDQSYKQDLSFLVASTIEMPGLDRLYDNQEWVACTVKGLVNEQFLESRFWSDYRPVDSERFEDLIIQTAKMVVSSKHLAAYLKEVAATALANKYIRAYVFMAGRDLPLVEGFRLFVKRTNFYNFRYLFQWIADLMLDREVDPKLIWVELEKYIPTLVRFVY